MRKRWTFIAFICLFLIGCGVKSHMILPYNPDPNLKINYSLSVKQLITVPDEVLEIMRSQLHEELSVRNLLATKEDSKFYKANIIINEYRMRHGASRALVGMMAGCDSIKSKVVVIDSNTENKVGESDFESRNCTAVGTSAGLIKDHIGKIAVYLSGK